jgi:hypothetical protein
MNFSELFQSAIEGGAKLSIKVKTDSLDFEGQEAFMYASIGYYISEIADLEYELDDFVAHVVEHRPKTCTKISRSFPFKIEDKAEFFVFAHAMLPELRRCGDFDGNLNLHFLFWRIIEIFDERNAVVHGTRLHTSTEPLDFKISVQKFKRVDRSNLRLETFTYNSAFIRHALSDIHYIRTFVWRAKEVLAGTGDPSMARDELLKGRSKMRELGQLYPDLFKL